MTGTTFKATVSGLDEVNSYENFSYYDSPDGYEEYCDYTILDNMRVREGPGKNYRILTRDELASCDYDISLKGSDAVLKKGSVVTCLGMEGYWMRIESGWICTKEGNTVYVR